MTHDQNQDPSILATAIPLNLMSSRNDGGKRLKDLVYGVVTVVLIAAIFMMITSSAYGKNLIILKCDFEQITTYRPYKSDYAVESVRRSTSATYRLEHPNNISTLENDGRSWSANICETGYCSIESTYINRTDKKSDTITLGTIKNVQMHTDLSWSINRETGSYLFSRVNVIELPGRNGETIIQKEEGRGACAETAAPTGPKGD